MVDWEELHPSRSLRCLSTVISDHCSILLDLGQWLFKLAEPGRPRPEGLLVRSSAVSKVILLSFLR